MSIIFLSTIDYPSGKIIEYNIESARGSKNKNIKAINDQLTFQEEISYGRIYVRKDNGDLWYINPNESTASFITRDQLHLFHNWDKDPLLPTEREFDILKQIGGLPSTKYSLYPDNLQFPARVTTRTGQQVDLCLFHFSKAPPFQSYFKKVLLLNDILDIKPSELALPYDLRLASTKAAEIRMSFSPFMVKTSLGKLLTYNGITQFASTGDIKGSEIIEEVDFSHDRFEKIVDVPLSEITFIIGKWDDRLQALFNQYTQFLVRYAASNFSRP